MRETGDRYSFKCDVCLYFGLVAFKQIDLVTRLEFHLRCSKVMQLNCRIYRLVLIKFYFLVFGSGIFGSTFISVLICKILSNFFTSASIFVVC